LVRSLQSLGQTHSQTKENNTMRLVRYSYPSYRTLQPARGLAPSPWSGLESEIDRLFQSALTDFAGSPDTRFPIDLHEDKDNYYVRAEVPGVSREDLNVEMVEDFLTIAATRKANAADEKADGAFSFTRSVNIPGDVQADKVNAAYENGIVTITLPKREETKPRKVAIAVK